MHPDPPAALRPLRRLFLSVSLLFAVALTACGGTTASAARITVTNAWARPMVVMAMAPGPGGMAMSSPAAQGSMTMPTTAASAAAGMTMGDGTTSAIYLTIVNKGGTPDRLIGASADVAQATELHKTVIDAQGVAQMEPVQGIAIPAHGTVVIDPGHYHIMLINLKQPLTVGQTFPATLQFQQSGPLPVTVTVRDQ